jgi:ribosome maturation factor RimP
MIGVDREAIGGIIERIVAREGLELVHWELVGPQNKSLLRIYIDKPGGITHSDCEVVSNEVGLLLDVEDLIPHSYTLEVSSPGIERGLYKQEDYERFAGSRVKLKTSEPINGQRNFRGRLTSISGNKIQLQDDQAGELEIDFEKVIKANIEYEFDTGGRGH